MMFFLTLSWASHPKHLLLRAFLEDCLPEMLSKVVVLAERGIKKSRKHHAIAPAALTGCGGLGQLWEALAELQPPFIHGSMDPWINGSMDPSYAAQASEYGRMRCEAEKYEAFLYLFGHPFVHVQV